MSTNKQVVVSNSDGLGKKDDFETQNIKLMTELLYKSCISISFY